MASRVRKFIAARRGGNFNMPVTPTQQSQPVGVVQSGQRPGVMGFIMSKRQFKAPEPQQQYPGLGPTVKKAAQLQQPDLMQFTKQSYLQPRRSSANVIKEEPTIAQLVGTGVNALTGNKIPWLGRFAEGMAQPYQIFGEAIAAGIAPKTKQVQAQKQKYNETLALMDKRIALAQTPEEKSRALMAKQDFITGTRGTGAAGMKGLDYSNKQVLGALAEIGLDVVTAGVGEGAAAGAKGFAKQAGKQTAKEIAGEVLKTGLKAAPLGTAYGVTGAMQQDAGLADTLKSAGIGTLFGFGLGAGGAAATKGLGKLGNVFGKAADPDDLVRYADDAMKYGDYNVARPMTRADIEKVVGVGLGRQTDEATQAATKLDDVLKGTKATPTATETLAKISPELRPLAKEASQYKSYSQFKGALADDITKAQRFAEQLPDEKALRTFYDDSKAVSGTKATGVTPSMSSLAKEVAVKNWLNDTITPSETVIDTLNPTGSLLGDSTPQKRITARLAPNITTLNKTAQKSANDTVWIYRGAPRNQKTIAPGDFITTNYDLAKSYTGEGNVLKKKVRLGDILDDIDEPLGEEYIYRPGADKEINQAVQGGTRATKEVSQEAPLRGILPEQQDAAISMPSTRVVEDTLGVPLQQTPPAVWDVESILRGTPSRERGFVGTVKGSQATSPELAKRVEGQYIPRRNDELSQTARGLIKQDINTAKDIALRGSDDTAVATANELIQHYQKQGDFDQAAQLANVVAERLTEHGRAIQAASLYGRLTPEGINRFAQIEMNKYNREMRLIGTPKELKLTGVQGEKLFTMAKEVEKMADGEDKAMAVFQLMNEVSDMIPTPVWRKVTAVWRAGLLTGLKTTERNIFSNILNFSAESASKMVAAALDNVYSAVTGKPRTVSWTSRGIGSGLKEGLKKGGRFLKTGFNERNILAKFDVRKINWGKSKVGRSIGAVTDGVFRFMGAQDQPIYYASLKNSLWEQAQVAAINAGKRGDTEFMMKLVKNPTDDMAVRATQEALTSVYQQETTLGTLAMGLKKAARKNRFAETALDFVLPFTRTPAGVGTQVMNYTPLGVIRALPKYIKGGKVDRRGLLMAFGRGAIGTTAFMGAGNYLMKSDRMTLDYPEDENERALWQLQGKKPFSIKIGDTWYSIGSIGPQATAMLIGGYYAVSGPMKAMFGGAKALKEQTFLKGMSAILDAWDEPDRYLERWVQQTSGSFVPTIVGDVARGIDQTARYAQSPWEAIKRKIPGLSQTVAPKRDVFGQEIKYQGGLPASMMDLFLRSPEKTSPVIQELERLEAAPTFADQKFTYEGEKRELTPEQYQEFQSIVGGLIETNLAKLMDSASYKKASDDNKKKAIQDVISDSRSAAKEKVLGKGGRKRKQKNPIDYEVRY